MIKIMIKIFYNHFYFIKIMLFHFTMNVIFIIILFSFFLEKIIFFTKNVIYHANGFRNN